MTEEVNITIEEALNVRDGYIKALLEKEFEVVKNQEEQNLLSESLDKIFERATQQWPKYLGIVTTEDIAKKVVQAMKTPII